MYESLVGRLMLRFLSRLFRGASLSSDAYNDVADDDTAVIDGIIILMLASVASGAGAIGLSIDELHNGGGSIFVSAFLANLMSWILWALTSVIVTSLFVQAIPSLHLGLRFLRTSLLAQAPVILRLLGFVPVFGPWAIIIVLAWQFAAMTVAVRQAFRLNSYWTALGPAVIGYIPVILINLFVLG
jgi:hypothetical protein